MLRQLLSRLFTLLIASLLFFTGNAGNSNNHIVISGHVTGMNTKKIYLSEARTWKIKLDSANVENDRFEFKLSIAADFEPFTGILTFFDQNGELKSLAFLNPFLKSADKPYRYAAFVVEPHDVLIEGSFAPTNSIIIKAGPGNDVLFKTQTSEFGYFSSKEDSITRQKIINENMALIRQYSFSHVLLEGIYFNKEKYNAKEIDEIISLFDANVRTMSLARRLAAYNRLRPDPKQPMPNLSLLTGAAIVKPVIDTSSKVNLLVFWASWCGPCLQEIPYLKELNHRYAGQGLRMASISIDKDSTSWIKALNKHNLNWEQYITIGSQKDDIEAIFNFSAIPVMVVTNNKGQILYKSVGYEPENNKKLETLIERFLK